MVTEKKCRKSAPVHFIASNNQPAKEVKEATKNPAGCHILGLCSRLG